MYFVSIKKYLKRVVLCLLAANPCIELLYAHSSVDEEVKQQEVDNDGVTEGIKKACKKRHKDMHEQIEAEDGEELCDEDWQSAWKKKKVKMHMPHEHGGNNLDKEFKLPQPQKPTPLSEELKKIKLEERIANDFIGEIPDPVQRMITHLQRYEERKKSNTPIPNRILLYGPPGNGKTLLAYVSAKHTEVAILPVSAPKLINKYQGESQRNITRFFDSAKEYVARYKKPIIIYIDEIDSIASDRNGNMQAEYKQPLMQLATEISDIQGNRDIFVIVSTNDLKKLDHAIKDRFGDTTCEIKDLDDFQRAKLIQKIYKDNGKEISYDCAVCMSVKVNDLSLWGRCSGRKLKDKIEAGFTDKKTDCENNPKNCNKPEFVYIWEKLLKDQSTANKITSRCRLLLPLGLLSIGCLNPGNPEFLFWVIEESLDLASNIIDGKPLDDHYFRDKLFTCERCFNQE